MPLPTEVKYFHSDMPGAPALSGVAGKYIDVLDACLVIGFGLKTLDSLVVSDGLATATISTGHSAEKYAVVEIAGATPAGLNGQHKVLSTTTNTVVFAVAEVADGAASGTITLKLAPAGWLKAFSGTNLAAYKSASPEATGMYLQVNDTTAFAARVQGFETMTSVTEGVNSFPTTTQVSTGVHNLKANNATGTRPWFVIANDRFAYVGVANHSSYPSAGYAVAAFGDMVSRKSVDAGRFMLRAQTVTANDSSYPNGASVFDAATASNLIYCARDFSALAASCRLQSLCMSGNNAVPQFSGNGAIPYPNGPDQSLIVAPQRIVEHTGKHLRGHFPGLYSSPQNLLDALATARVGVFFDSVLDLPGAVLAAIPSSPSGATPAYGFIDVIGPWGN